MLLPDAGASDDRRLSYWVEQRLLPLREQDEAVQREAMLRAWRELDRRERFVWNKLITGAFRVGVSQHLVDAGARARRAASRPERSPTA